MGNQFISRFRYQRRLRSLEPKRLSYGLAPKNDDRTMLLLFENVAKINNLFDKIKIDNDAFYTEVGRLSTQVERFEDTLHHRLNETTSQATKAQKHYDDTNYQLQEYSSKIFQMKQYCEDIKDMQDARFFHLFHYLMVMVTLLTLFEKPENILKFMWKLP